MLRRKNRSGYGGDVHAVVLYVAMEFDERLVLPVVETAVEKGGRAKCGCVGVGRGCSGSTFRPSNFCANGVVHGWFRPGFVGVRQTRDKPAFCPSCHHHPKYHRSQSQADLRVFHQLHLTIPTFFEKPGNRETFIQRIF